MLERKAFLTKPKHQYHLSQWGECVYVAQLWKKEIIWASMFVMFDRITLIPKNAGKKSFSYQAKASISSIPIRGMCLWFLIMKKSRFFLASMFVTIDRITLIPKLEERKAILINPKHQCHLSQRGECVYGAQSWNERRLWCEFKFLPIGKRTITL